MCGRYPSGTEPCFNQLLNCGVEHGVNAAGSRYSPQNGGQEVVMKRRMARMRDWLNELDFLGALLALFIGAGRLEPKPIPVRVRRRR